MNQTPESFKAYCDEKGIKIERCESTLTLVKTFEPGSKEGYTAAESVVSIIYDTPSAGSGSVWGTDGGSIGGMVGMNNGYMRLNKSNVAKRFLVKLKKLL